MNFLETILSHKREEVTARKQSVLRSRLEDLPKFSYPRISLLSALQGKELAVIAEIKKASPSKQVIREHFEPLQLAREFVRGGASALSVLTDEKFFRGKLEYIEKMRNFITVPILRKDFIIDRYQLYEAKAYGADAVLLIAAALTREELSDLHDEASGLGLECLVEIHNEDEIEKLNLDQIKLVGINNRDLMSFEVDILTSVTLKKYLPPSVLIVSESGIATAKDIELLMGNDIHAVLIGEHFMKSPQPGRLLAEMLAEATGNIS